MAPATEQPHSAARLARLRENEEFHMTGKILIASLLALAASACTQNETMGALGGGALGGAAGAIIGNNTGSGDAATGAAIGAAVGAAGGAYAGCVRDGRCGG